MVIHHVGWFVVNVSCISICLFYNHLNVCVCVCVCVCTVRLLCESVSTIKYVTTFDIS